MRKRVLCVVGLGGLIALGGLNVTAQEPKAADQPKPPGAGELIPSTFRQFLVTDGRYPPNDVRNRAGKIHCLVCENGLAPVVAIFVRADPETLPPDKGVAELIKRTNDLIPKYRADKLAAFVTFLKLEGGKKTVTLKTIGEDKSETETKVAQDLEYPDETLENREKLVESIRQFAAGLKTPNVPFGLAADKSRAVSQWGLGDDPEGKKEDDKDARKDLDDVTVVLYYRMREVGKWKFKKATEIEDKDVTKILKSVEDTINNTRR